MHHQRANGSFLDAPEGDRSTADAMRLPVFLAAVLALLALGLLVQVLLYYQGFLAIGPDDSALTLRAYDATWRDALSPGIVPPFHPLVNGLALRLVPDLVRTPRALAGVFGVLTSGALMLLAWHLFRCRAVVLLTGLLAAFLKFRAVLAVAPLPEIFYAFWFASGAAFTAAWLRDARPRDLTLACLCLGIGTTIRFQGWLASFALVMILSYVGLAVRREPLRRHVVNLLLLTGFPLAWFLASAATGGFERFVTNPGGFPFLRLTAGFGLIWKGNAYQFLQQAMISPLVAGLVALGFYWFRSAAIRVWSLLLIVPLLGMSLMALLTRYLPVHDYWRTAAPSLLLLVPFLARLIHEIGKVILPGSRARVLMTSVAGLCFAAGFYNGTSGWVRQSDFTPDDRRTGTFLRHLAESRDASILIDSSSWHDLHVMVASGIPERFVRNTGIDPDHPLPPVIDPVGGIDMERIEQRGIGVLVLDQKRLQQLVEASGRFRMLHQQGDWRIYYHPRAAAAGGP